ncbi:NADP-dependent oxidoreductase domain-containing protein [Lenzites betulinus]|nr:NADP-dependent oxidoreductase domain-containing protein [Lenzites betulinus]
MVKTTTLGGTAKEIVVAKVAHGLMTMTVGKEAISDEQAFESIRSGVDALPPGAKMLLNSAEFYDNERGTSNLELLARFYERYPGYAKKTFLSVKGGITEGHHVDKCIAALRGTKQIDLFQPARIDRDVTIEDTMRTLAELVREEKFNHIGLTECRAETIRRGHAIHPIAIVEIEISPLVYEEETKRGS